MMSFSKNSRDGATPMVSTPGGRSAGPRASTGSTQATEVDCNPFVPARDGNSNATGRNKAGRAQKKSPPKGNASRKRARVDDFFSSQEASDQDEAWPQIEDMRRPVEIGDNTYTPRYLVVESDTPDRPLVKCNLFTVKKWFMGVSTLLYRRIRKMAGGGFLVDCPNSHVAKLLLRRNGCEFISLKIKVSAHRSLNSCKGVIWCPDLEGYNDDEILDDVKDKGVTQVQRCYKKRGGLRVPTHTFFLTFGKTTLPEYLYIGFSHVKVKPFDPKPLQCYTCYGFGHPSIKCKKKDNPICGRCGHEAHEGKCMQAAHCPNCKGDHGPTARECPKYKKEALIRKIMNMKKIPFREAKVEADREIEDSVPQRGRSFANAAASAIGRQTPTPGLCVQCSRQTQIGVSLHEDVRAEALALASNLRTSLRSGGNKQVPASNSSEAKQTNKNNKQRSAKQTQAKPGNATAPAPQAAVDKQASKPPPKKPQASKPVPSSSKAKPGVATPSPSQAARKDKGLKDAASASTEAEMEEETTSAPALQVAEGVESSISFGFSSPIRTTLEKTGEKAVVFTGGSEKSPCLTPTSQKVEPTKAVLTAPKLNINSDKYKVSYSRAIRGANTVSSASQGSSSPGKEKSTKLVPFRPKSPPKESSFESSNRFASLQEEESDQGDLTEDDDSNDDMEYVSS